MYVHVGAVDAEIERTLNGLGGELIGEPIVQVAMGPSSDRVLLTIVMVVTRQGWQRLDKLVGG